MVLLAGSIWRRCACGSSKANVQRRCRDGEYGKQSALPLVARRICVCSVAKMLVMVTSTLSTAFCAGGFVRLSPPSTRNEGARPGCDVVVELDASRGFNTSLKSVTSAVMTVGRIRREYGSHTGLRGLCCGCLASVESLCKGSNCMLHGGMMVSVVTSSC